MLRTLDLLCPLHQLTTSLLLPHATLVIMVVALKKSLNKRHHLDHPSAPWHRPTPLPPPASRPAVHATAGCRVIACRTSIRTVSALRLGLHNTAAELMALQEKQR